MLLTHEWPKLSKNKINSKKCNLISILFADKIIECGTTLLYPQYIENNLIFKNKCFICAFLTGYEKIDEPVNMQNILEDILTSMIIFDINIHEMIDTDKHKEFIKSLEDTYNVYIYVYADKIGHIGYPIMHKEHNAPKDRIINILHKNYHYQYININGMLQI